MTVDLITDRKLQDVKRVKTLKAKIDSSGWPALTDDEKSEWLASMKGRYEHSDLNRVGEAIAYLSGLLSECGIYADVSPITDWAAGDRPNETQIERFFSDISAIRAALTMLSTTPPAPPGPNLTYTQANNIEQILLDVEDAINRMALSGWGCGEIGCGEV